jgi:diguanylate cyclase (GGDEF)-like protein/PAS domain S-box-containing protein
MGTLCLRRERLIAAGSFSSRPLNSRFGRQVAFPVATLVAAAMLAIVLFVAYSAARQSRDAQEQATRATRHALETKAEEIARTAQDYAWWNDAVRNLDLELDLTWADNYIGRYIHETFGYDVTFLIGRDDRTRYMTIDGERHAADAFALAPGLEHLVAQARAIPRDQPGAVSAYLMLDGAIAIFGVSPITPEPTEPIDAPQGPRAVLVYAELLDRAELLDPIADTLRLRDLRVVPPEAARDATLPLTAPDGTTLGGLTWQPPPLGQELVRDLAPPLLLALGLIAGFTWFVLDHARKAARTIEAGEARFRDIAEASADWIWETDAEGRLVFVSERFAEMMGLASQALLMRPFSELFGDGDGGSGVAGLRQAMEARRPFRDLLCPVEDGTGQRRVLRFAGKPALDGFGRLHGYRGTASDVTAQIAAERRAHFLALHDPMTELPNRELLWQRLEQALAGLRRRDGMTAVLMIDLDRFKSVNDTLGHAAGDRLLKLCSRRLEACVRETDTVARLGGDEFALIQVGVEGPAAAQALCGRLLAALVEPFELDGHDIIITASVGVALAPSDAEEPGRLLQYADVALYRAKAEGRNTFRFFEPEMDGRLQARRALERDLRTALVRGELEVHYQIQVDARAEEPVGVEALARWHHPERGWVPPKEFIPVAEETGLILLLGEQVLRTACAHAVAWPTVRLSVNLSPVQFRHGDLVGLIQRALQESGLEANRLELEITEGVLLADMDAALGALGKLRQLGVRIAMDDFGTGYSSFGYLQKFPFDTIKIDGSFIGALHTRSEADAIVRAVVSLGRSLGMRTCAEGVETAEQLAFLKAEGCDEVQGYYLSRPLPASDVARLLNQAASSSNGTPPVAD